MLNVTTMATITMPTTTAAAVAASLLIMELKVLRKEGKIESFLQDTLIAKNKRT